MSATGASSAASGSSGGCRIGNPSPSGTIAIESGARMADGDVCIHSDTAGSLSRAAEPRNTPERTANSHNHVEIVAVHDRQVGDHQAAQGAHGDCIGVVATRGLCEYDRIAPSAPRKRSVVFPIAPVAHGDLDSITSPFQIRSATGQHRRHGGVSGGGKGRGQGL